LLLKGITGKGLEDRAAERLADFVCDQYPADWCGAARLAKLKALRATHRVGLPPAVRAKDAPAKDNVSCENQPQAIPANVQTCGGYTSRTRGQGSAATQAFTMACAFDIKKEYDDALTHYTRTIDLDPNFAPAYLNRGELKRQRGESLVAIADFTKVIGLDPKNIIAYNGRAMAYRDKHESKQDMDKAISDFSRVIAHDSRYVDAYINRGYVYFYSNDYNRAINDFRAAVAIDPNSDAGPRGLGDVYYKDSDHSYDDAIEQFSKAIGINCANSTHYNARGVAYNDRGVEENRPADFALAIEDYTKAIALDNNYARFYRNRAVTYQKVNKLDNSIGDYTSAINKDSKNVEFYVRRGQAYILRNQAGDRERAIEDYRTALSIDPNHEPAKNALKVLGVN